MRVLLFTGKGGVGKTTTAAATGVLAASQGLKTLVLSTDSAHSLADALGVDVGAGPTEVEAGLYVHQADPEVRLAESWGQIQSYLLTVLETSGLDRLRAEELTVLPGAEEVLALLELRDQVRSGRWDVVVVDCAPTAETLRLLALPEALDWYISKLYPIERKVARALRPVLGSAVGLPLPQQPVLEAADRLRTELLDVQQMLRASTTSVRLVLTPESVVVAEARRTFTSLSLFGYRVDAIIANRVFPDGDGDWQQGWVAAQRHQLAEVVDSFEPLPVLTVPYQPAEPVGSAALLAFGQTLYDSTDPFAVLPDRDLLTVERVGEGFVLSVTLPLADRRDVDLVRVGDDIVVTVSSRRRVLALPAALRRCTVTNAALLDGRLAITFLPDRAQWPDGSGVHP